MRRFREKPDSLPFIMAEIFSCLVDLSAAFTRSMYMMSEYPLRLQVTVKTGEVIYSKIGEQYRGKADNSQNSHPSAPPSADKSQM